MAFPPQIWPLADYFKSILMDKNLWPPFLAEAHLNLYYEQIGIHRSRLLLFNRIKFRLVYPREFHVVRFKPTDRLWLSTTGLQNESFGIHCWQLICVDDRIITVLWYDHNSLKNCRYSCTKVHRCETSGVLSLCALLFTIYLVCPFLIVAKGIPLKDIIQAIPWPHVAAFIMPYPVFHFRV